MKVTVPETAVETLKSILEENQDKPNNIRVFFQGMGWAGPSFGLALDQLEESDLTHEVDGLNFIMSQEEFDAYGDIVIQDTGFGFKVVPESMVGESCDCNSGCSGCCS